MKQDAQRQGFGKNNLNWVSCNSPFQEALAETVCWKPSSQVSSMAMQKNIPHNETTRGWTALRWPNSIPQHAHFWLWAALDGLDWHRLDIAWCSSWEYIWGRTRIVVAELDVFRTPDKFRDTGRLVRKWDTGQIPTLRQFLAVAGEATDESTSWSPKFPAAMMGKKSWWVQAKLSTSDARVSYTASAELPQESECILAPLKSSKEICGTPHDLIPEWRK